MLSLLYVLVFNYLILSHYILLSHAYSPQPLTCDGSWYTVVNNADPIPDKVDFDGKNFSSYNAASVNNDGLVVFRARSTGGDNPSTGIFVRDMPNGKLVRQAGRRTLVPPPNNLDTTFFEFPSFPRMSITNDYIATRGNHDPVLKYVLERRVLAEDEDEADTTRVGNTGIFFNLRAKDDTETAPDTSPNFKTGMNISHNTRPTRMNSNFFDFIHVFNAFYTSIGGVHTLITNEVDICYSSNALGCAPSLRTFPVRSACNSCEAKEDTAR